MTEEELKVISDRWRRVSGPWKHVIGDYDGSDWLVCHVGESLEDGKEHWVTTDGVRASELLGDAGDQAEFIAHAWQDIKTLGKEVRRLRQPPLAGIERSIEIVKQRRQFLQSIGQPVGEHESLIKANPGAIAVLDDVLVFLEAELLRWREGK